MFIHIFNTGLHVFILFCLIFFGFLEVVRGPLDLAVQDLHLHFRGRDLLTQREDVLIDTFEFIFKGRGLVFQTFDVIYRI